MSIKDRVREFVVTNFYVPESMELRDDASLLMEGIVDSTGVLELVAFLEQTFDISVEDDELAPENMDSLEQIEAFVKRKQAA